MNISHLILIEIDTDRSTIALKTKDIQSLKFDYYSRKEYIKSFAICTDSKFLAASIKSGLEALLFNYMIENFNGIKYSISALDKVIKGCNFYKSEIPGIEIIKNIKDLANFEIPNLDTHNGIREFYDNYNLIINQIDEIISNGAEFSKNNRKDQISIIHNRNLPILDQLNFDWVYNKDNNIVFDNIGLARWKREGRFPEHRRLIEMKYFR
ncbi:MAG: hypothetical protein K0R59_2751 [Sphingobacterium sp.]|jgi:hypothetical protein|uniref:hypothetical protein n=1 Tax=Sphingobacterium sp. NGMCC 1.201703 TaxID=3388657 RepID=UPI002A615F31|nr:hypothetical protein [Sphingobacterium sp.]